jgi:hypothetical protein
LKATTEGDRRVAAVHQASGLRPRLRVWLRRVAMRLPPGIRRWLRFLYVTLLRRRQIHPELESAYARLLGAQGGAKLRAQAAGARGLRVLIATNIGSYQHGMALDSALGVALTLRGARVDYMQCDAFLPACQAMDIGTVDPSALADGQRPYLCDGCVRQGASLFALLGLPRLAMSELVDTATRAAIRERVSKLSRDELAAIKDGGIAAGEHAQAGALRFYARGDLAGEPAADGVLRRYAEGALSAAAAVERAIEREHYDVVVAHHGIYVPQGLVNEVCRKRGVRLVTWTLAYRKHCFIFSHGDTYHHTMVAEPTETWDRLPWSDELERETLRYLNSRWDGGEDWIHFHTDPQHSLAAVTADIGLDPSRPIITLLSNVVWDAQLHYPSNAFRSMLDWVFETIRYFARRPDLQLVIRVHPAEITGFLPSRQHLAEEIARAFPELPPNVYVVPPASDVSTYVLCENSNAVLIYNTKTGIELTAKGIPTVVAGEAWIRNKGFCHAPTTAAEYFAILDRLPFAERMSDDERRRALIYAYHVFFRRMIPLPFLTAPERGRFNLELDALEDLSPERFPGLDVICRGILQGKEFVYPAEIYAQSETLGPGLAGRGRD